MSDLDERVGANGLGLWPEVVPCGGDTYVAEWPDLPHGIAWLHYCTQQVAAGDLGWGISGVGAHDVTGSIAGADLTISPSILCTSCGKHGFLTRMAWRDC